MLPDLRYDVDELLERIAQGDEAAFARFYHHFRNKVFSVAFTYTEQTVTAEEVVQDVFVSVWKKRQQLQTILNPDAWLYTIARNFSLNALQQMARADRDKQVALSHLPAQATDVQDSNDLSSLKTLLQAAMELLSPQQRKVFELSRMEGYSRDEIAEMLDLAPSTVSSHLTISLRTVRAFLANRIDLILLLILLDFTI